MKLISIDDKKEPEIAYLNPQVPAIMEYVQKFIDQFGCAEILIVMLDGDDAGHIFNTDETSPHMLGHINLAKYRYTAELDAVADE